jgi:type II secretory pathway component GspD/PulD (secretin)
MKKLISLFCLFGILLYAPTYPKENKENGYTINFKNIPITEYLNFVSRTCDVNFLFDEKDLNFSINVISKEKITKENILSTLLQILRIQGLSLLEQNENLVIHKNPAIKQFAKIVTDETTDISSPIITKIFRIENAKIDSLAAIIQPMISEGAILEISPDTRHLIITDITTNVKKISDLIEIIDSPQNPLEIEIYKTKENSPEYLINLATKIMAPLTGGLPLILVPQKLSGSIFIVSTPKLIEKSISVLNSLDLSRQPGIKKNLEAKNILIYKIKNQSKAEIEKSLQQISVNLEEGGYSTIGIIEAIKSAKWIKDTNSFLFTGTPESLAKLDEILLKIDVPYKEGILASKISFFTYKPQNRRLKSIEEAIKELSENLSDAKIANKELIDTLRSVKIVASTKSLLFTGDTDTFPQAKSLLESIDQPFAKPLTSIGKTTFFIYKLQHQAKNQVLSAIQNTVENLKKEKVPEKTLITSLENVKYIPETNSLLFTGKPDVLQKIQTLLPSFDVDLSKHKILPSKSKFFIYKPKNQPLEDMAFSLKEISENLEAANLVNPSFMKTIDGMKTVKATNSLLFTGDEDSIQRIQELLEKLDIPKEPSPKEVFFLYKLQNTSGNIIEEDLDNFINKLKTQKIQNPKLVRVLENAKWITETNSIMLAGDSKSVEEAKIIIGKYDIPRKEDSASHDNFLLYKPKFASPSFIEQSLLDTAHNLQKANLADPNLINAINSVKIIESTDSLAFTGTSDAIAKIKELISTIDTPAALEPRIEIRGKTTYLLYKIQKANPQQLISSIRSITIDLKKSKASDKNFIAALESMKYKPETNSLLFTGTKPALEKVNAVVEKFDVVSKIPPKGPYDYLVYKPKYLSGPSLEKILHDFADHLKLTGFENQNLYNAIQNIKWNPNTNSLIVSGDQKSIEEIRKLLITFDIPGEDKIPKDIIQPIAEISFLVYKLQFHKGDEIQNALKQIAEELSTHKDMVKQSLLNAINSIQWIEMTNSLLCSGDQDTMKRLKELIQNLDVPLKQVFIEVLVIETTITNTLNFGLDWGAKYKHKERLVTGIANTADASKSNPFMGGDKGLNKLSESVRPDTSSITFLNGFDLGIIGDYLFHKGKSFLSFGSFVNALQTDTEMSVITTPKIITQDNKTSTIFFGTNVPYVGANTQIIGQNTSSITQNVEYRDVGTSLSLTPVLGNADVVTLNISLQRSKEIGSSINISQDVVGVKTSKASMQTTVHIPNKNFLVLSGLVQNSKSKAKTGIPCLGGLPLIGAAFSQNNDVDDKQNIVIFIRPHIINSYKDLEDLTNSQAERFRENAGSPMLENEFDEGLELLKTYDDE